MTATESETGTARCLEFGSAEYHERWRRLREAAPQACDAIVISSPETLRYLCGYRSLLSRSRWRPTILVIPCNEHIDPFLCLPEQEVGIGRSHTAVEDLCVVLESVRDGHEDPIERLVVELDRRGLGHATVGIEAGFGQRAGMTLAEVEQVKRLRGTDHYLDAAGAIWATRARKSSAELDCLRRACAISCAGVRAGFEELRPGMTERELHRIMYTAMIEEGAEDVWLAIGSGAKGYEVYNSYPSDLQLHTGDLIWVDGGAYFRGYVCDFIRSAVLGQPTPIQSRWHRDALAANRVGLDNVAEGARCGDIFGAVHAYLESIGRAEAWGLDVLGHGVGLEIHELPSISERSDVQLQAGNVVTIEPSLSPPHHEHGHYIVEEVVVVQPEGYELLTEMLPPELWIAG